MTQGKTLKKTVDTTLCVTFILVLATGIMLHLKSHGILIQPRPVLKAIHYILGFLMTACVAFHATVYFKPLIAMQSRHRWFCTDTWILLILFIAVLATGLVKLLSPVKIPHLGLWHYILGLIMSAAAIIHLWIALPYLLDKYRRR